MIHPTYPRISDGFPRGVGAVQTARSRTKILLLFPWDDGKISMEAGVVGMARSRAWMDMHPPLHGGFPRGVGAVQTARSRMKILLLFPWDDGKISLEAGVVGMARSRAWMDMPPPLHGGFA